jgi:hypothetical protein
VSRRRRDDVLLVRGNPAIDDLWLWLGGTALVGLALWEHEAVIQAGKDVVDAVTDTFSRGKRVTYAGVGDDGVVPISPSSLRTSASLELGREVSQDVYDLARMIRSEGATEGRIRAHVALNDAADLGWSVHVLLTYSTNPRAKGWFGEQFTPAARAPDGVRSVRRYSTAHDPYVGDIQLAEQVLFERQGGADPTAGAVKFVDKSGLSAQEGASSYEAIVASWAKEGLQPFTVPGYSDDLVVFRRVG